MEVYCTLDVYEKFDVPDWVEEAAYDFAEEVVGRYDFPRNWRRLSEDLVSRTATVYSWMHRHLFDPSRAEDLIKVLDSLAEDNDRWRQ